MDSAGARASNPQSNAVGQTRQKYTFSEVKTRAKKLTPGMNRYQVGVLLGSPAETRGSTWIYLPQKQRILLPQELLEVRFDRGVYASHEFKPILFGQTPEN